MEEKITQIVETIKELLKQLKKEGIDVKEEKHILKVYSPDVNITYTQEELKVKLEELTKLQKVLEEQKIYNQIKKSMIYLEEALNYEDKISQELKTYVEICRIALKKLEEGLNTINDENAIEIYETIYKIIKVEIANGQATLLDDVMENENNKKYINELIREDIIKLTNATFIKSQELVALNKAVSFAEVNIDKKSRLVDLDVIKAIVECYSLETRRVQVVENIKSTRVQLEELKEKLKSKVKGKESQLVNRDKVYAKTSTETFKLNIKKGLCCGLAIITIIGNYKSLEKTEKSEKLTESSIGLIAFNAVALTATVGLAAHIFERKNLIKLLDQELSSINDSINNLENEIISGLNEGEELLNQVELLYDYMTSSSSYSALTEEERELLEDSTISSMEGYFDYTKKLNCVKN